MQTLLLITLLAAPSNVTVGNNLSAGGTASAAALSATSSATAKTFSTPAPSSDAAPDPVTVKAANAYRFATTAAYKNGAPLLLSGGIGQTVITIANSSTIAGDTLTWARTVSGVTPANVVWTEGAGTYNCSGLGADSDANRDACACLLYTYCNANLPSGVNACYRLDGTCSDSSVYVQWVPYTTTAAKVTPLDASVTVTQGTYGEVMALGAPDVAGVKIRVGIANDVGLGLFSSNVALCSNAACTGYIQANINGGAYFSGAISQVSNIVMSGTLTSSATGNFGWHPVNAPNQACDTTCTSAAVVGFDTATSLFVAHDDATADSCICAGAN